MQHTLDRSISPGMLLRFSLPTIASSIFMSVYSSVDGVFVSRLIGTDALSAVNLVMPLVLFAMVIGTMFGAGGNALVAKKLGEGKNEEAKQDFSLLVAVAFVVSCALCILGLVFLGPLLRLLGADAGLLGLCRDYAVPTLLLYPLSVFSMLFQMSFITVGRATVGLLLSVAGGLTNIALDYWFIAKLGGGIAGAAIATGIGYAVPALAGLVYFWAFRRGSLYLVRPRWRWRVIAKSCSNGASEMVGSLSSGIVTLLLNNILMRLAGADGVAAITIILYAQGVLSSAYMGYSYGVAPIISYNYGKQDTARLKRIYSLSLRGITALSLAVFVLSLAFAQPLVAIFTQPGTPVFTLAVHGYRVFSVCFLFMGVNAFASALFTALSNGRVSAILAFFRTLVFFTGAVLGLAWLLGVEGVWMAIPLAEVLGLAMALYYFRKMRPVYGYC